MQAQECLVCGPTEHTFLFRTRDRHYGVKDEFTIVRCAKCGLLKLDPMPSEGELSRYYSEAYYAYQPFSKPNWLQRVKQRLNRSPIPSHNPSFSRTGDFLDVGCGSGAYLSRMRELGWNVRGVEPGSYGANTGRQAGFDIFQGTLLQAKFASESFDYVRSNHSFEHMPNPLEVLQEMYRILRPGGMLYIGVPNVEGLAFRVFGRYWWYMGAPLHTYSYSPKTLSHLLGRVGFRVKSVYYNSNFESLSGSLQIYLNRNSDRLSTDGWVFRSRILRYPANVLERMLDLFHLGDAIEVISEKPVLPVAFTREKLGEVS